MPRVIRVIESDVMRGKGTPYDPVRHVPQYWTLDGKTLLAEEDGAMPELKLRQQLEMVLGHVRHVLENDPLGDKTAEGIMAAINKRIGAFLNESG